MTSTAYTKDWTGCATRLLAEALGLLSQQINSARRLVDDRFTHSMFR